MALNSALATPLQADTKAKAIQKYLLEGFGIPGYKTTWYDSIKGISVQGSKVIATTSLSKKDATASGICSGVSGYVFSKESQTARLDTVEIRGVGGVVLLRRVGIQGKCF